jgi:transposase
VPLDESSVNLEYTRLYGRALTNGRVSEGVKDVRFKRQSILSAIRLNGSMCPIVFEGTLNKELFAEYLKTCLKPALSPDDVVLLDNSSVHKSKLVLKTLAECDIKYLFLPPYSPDFNPTELLWAWLKGRLRKMKARIPEKLQKAINFSLSEVRLDFVGNWFRHCGLATDIC